MTPEQENALIELVAEMAGAYIAEMERSVSTILDSEQRADRRRESHRLCHLLFTLRGDAA